MAAAKGEMMARESSREKFMLLDLIHAIQDEAKDDREVVATLQHLLTRAWREADAGARRTTGKGACGRRVEASFDAAGFGG